MTRLGGERVSARVLLGRRETKARTAIHISRISTSRRRAPQRELPTEEDQMTIPSSKTRFVDANWKASAVPRDAPFWKSDFAIAIAA